MFYAACWHFRNGHVLPRCGSPTVVHAPSALPPPSARASAPLLEHPIARRRRRRRLAMGMACFA
eukprot:10127963-Alexandrium_andersonii.AAC.1